MSEVAKNAEIEDVLSSIRRLVAGTEAGRRAAMATTPEDPDALADPQDAPAGEAPADDGETGDAQADDMDPGDARAGDLAFGDSSDEAVRDAVAANGAAPDLADHAVNPEAAEDAFSETPLFDSPPDDGSAGSPADDMLSGGHVDAEMSDPSPADPSFETAAASDPNEGPGPIAGGPGGVEGAVAEDSASDLPPGTGTGQAPDVDAIEGATDPGGALMLEPSQRVQDAGGETTTDSEGLTFGTMGEATADDPAESAADASDDAGPAPAAEGLTPDLDGDATPDIARTDAGTDDPALAVGTAGTPPAAPAPVERRRSPFLSPALQRDRAADGASPVPPPEEAPAASSEARGFGFGIAPRSETFRDDPVRHVPLHQLPGAESEDLPAPSPTVRGTPIISPDFRRPPAPVAHRAGEIAGGPAGDDADTGADDAATEVHALDVAVDEPRKESPADSPAPGAQQSGDRAPVQGAAADGCAAQGERGTAVVDGAAPEMDTDAPTETGAPAPGPQPSRGHAPEPGSLSQEGPPNLFAAATASLDGASIRAMIAECVRQELEGPTGQRASERIRALVRAEIARALAEHDRRS